MALINISAITLPHELGDHCILHLYYIYAHPDYYFRNIDDINIIFYFAGHPFPNSFESSVKKFHRYLFHILAHIYHAHYSDVVTLSIHGHLNSVFTHFMIFNIKFDLMDEKETDILQDLMKALIKQLPDPNQNEGTENDEISRT